MSTPESERPENGETVTKLLFVTFGLVLAFILYFSISLVVKFSVKVSKVVTRLRNLKRSSSKKHAPGMDKKAEDQPLKPQPKKERALDLKELIKAEKASKRASKGSKKEIQHQHEMFVTGLKGHGDGVTALNWSTDGLQLATACEDQYLRVFDTSDLSDRDPRVRRVKTTRKPSGVGFTGTGGLLAALEGVSDVQVAIYAPSKAASGGPSFEELQVVNGVLEKDQLLKAVAVCPSASPLTPVGGAAPGGFMACISAKKSVRVVDWSGRVLATLEPNSLENHDIAISADGRFIAVASFTSEAKIWEMTYARAAGGASREFKGCFKVMDLKGHRGQLTSVALSPCGRRAATASLDGTLRVWNIDVRYGLGEDAKITLMIPMPLPAGKSYRRMAFGANGLLAAAAGDGRVHIINADNGELVDSVVAHDLPITALEWCPVPRELPEKDAAAAGARPGAKRWVFATASEDKRVRLWRV